MNLDDIRAALRRDDLAAAEIGSILKNSTALASAASTNLAALEAKRAEIVLANDAERLEYRGALATARDNAEDAAALVLLVEDRLARAQADEAQNARRERYDAAQAEAEAAKRALRRYPKLAAEIRDLIEVVARAEMAVRAANADLPEGAERIASPEQVVRGRAGSDGAVLSATEVVLWAYAGSGEPVDGELAGLVQDLGKGCGALVAQPSKMGSATVPLIRRRFRRIERIPPARAVVLDEIASTVVLPRFTYLDAPVFEPSRWSDPESVVQHVERFKNLRSRHADPETEPVVEYEPLSDRVEAQDDRGHGLRLVAGE